MLKMADVSKEINTMMLLRTKNLHHSNIKILLPWCVLSLFKSYQVCRNESNGLDQGLSRLFHDKNHLEII